MQTVPSAHEALRPHIIGAVAVGGAVGASARWGVAEIIATLVDSAPPDVFPWATLTVNILGSLCIAIAAVRLVRGTRAWAFTVTGVLGGFTTMSTLAVELNDLADAGRTDTAALYVVATLGVAAIAFAAAERLATPSDTENPS